MKTNKIKNPKNTPKSKEQDFDSLVQKLQSSVQPSRCCSNQNACDLRCSPLNDGCNPDGESDCC